MRCTLVWGRVFFNHEVPDQPLNKFTCLGFFNPIRSRPLEEALDESSFLFYRNRIAKLTDPFLSSVWGDGLIAPPLLHGTLLECQKM